MSTEPTLFERIVAREIPADIVFENDRIIAIQDIAPQAPVHLLVFPKTAQYRTSASSPPPTRSCSPRSSAPPATWPSSTPNGQFRLVFNTGADAGQTVFHVHAHVLAGGTIEEGSLGKL